MGDRDHIENQMREAAPGRLGDMFEIGAQPADAAGLFVTRAEDARLLTCTVGRRSTSGRGGGLMLAPRDAQTSPAASAALLSSRLVAYVLPGARALDAAELAALAWPQIPTHFRVQLEILWRSYTRSRDPAMIGAFDRIAAELYMLTIDDLMTFERAWSA